jgi:outer membrane protein assembly factor BamB
MRLEKPGTTAVSSTPRKPIEGVREKFSGKGVNVNRPNLLTSKICFEHDASCVAYSSLPHPGRQIDRRPHHCRTLRFLLVAFALSFTLLPLTKGLAHAQLAATPWPMLQHDPQHTGQATGLGPAFTNLPVDLTGVPVLNPLLDTIHVQTWKAPDKIKMSPVIGPDGTVNVGMGFFFVSIDPSGMIPLWPQFPPQVKKSTKNLRADVSANAAAVGQTPQGVANCAYTVYVGDRDNSLSAFCPDGSLRWRYNIGHEGDILSSPVVGPDGTIYFTHNQINQKFGAVVAIKDDPQDPRGWSCSWLSILGVEIKGSSLALSADGSTLYVGSTNGQLHALRTNPTPTNPPQLPLLLVCPGGEEKSGWPVQVGTKLFDSSPVISPATGKIYIGTDLGLVEVNPQNPTQQRLFDTTIATSATKKLPPQVGMVDNTAAITSDGSIIYAAARYSKFRALFAFRPLACATSICKSSWEYDFKSGSPFSAFPVIGADGTFYVGMDKSLAAFPAGGGTQPLWYMPTKGYIISYPAIAGNNTLYIGSTDRLVYKVVSQ